MLFRETREREREKGRKRDEGNRKRGTTRKERHMDAVTPPHRKQTHSWASGREQGKKNQGDIHQIDANRKNIKKKTGEE